MQVKARSYSQQRGAILAVSLVLLLVMTILGVATMDSTNLELKMSSNNQNRQKAFQAAETALKIVEARIANKANTVTNRHYNSISALQDCSAQADKSKCYDASCEGGLCFAGTYAAGDDQIRCEINDGSSVKPHPWNDSSLDVFTTNTKHLTAAIENFDDDVKYIVEFLCYVSRDESLPFDAKEGHRNNGIPLFRITARAESGNASVTLQSTYRYVDNS